MHKGNIIKFVVFSLTIFCVPLFIDCNLLVLQIPATVTRILLNHFKWDKEKLMEWYVNVTLCDCINI